MSNVNEYKKIIRGSGELISELTGFSPTHVSLVLRGKRNNLEIEKAAKDVLEMQQILLKTYKLKKSA